MISLPLLEILLGFIMHKVFFGSVRNGATKELWFTDSIGVSFFFFKSMFMGRLYHDATDVSLLITSLCL